MLNKLIEKAPSSVAFRLARNKIKCDFSPTTFGPKSPRSAKGKYWVSENLDFPKRNAQWTGRLQRDVEREKSNHHSIGSSCLCLIQIQFAPRREEAMIRNNNFPYFSCTLSHSLPHPGFYANGLQIVVVIWLTICCFSFSSFFRCVVVVWCGWRNGEERREKGKTIFISTSSLSSSMPEENCYFVF